MKKYITFALILLTSTSTALLETKTHSIQIDINNPCELIKTQYERGIIEEYDSDRDGYNNYMLKQCDSQFNLLMKSTLESLRNCVPHRSTRQILSSVLTASRLITGVTDFISTATSTGDLTQNLITLGQSVLEKTKRLVSPGPERRNLELATIFNVSETAELHQKELSIADARLMPQLLFASFHISREIIAGISNLMTIASHCSQGKLATSEIAELTNSWDLININPADTTVTHVNVDLNDHVVEIFFQLRENHTPSTDFIKYVLISTIVIILLIITVLNIWFTLKRKYEPIYTTHLEPYSSPTTTNQNANQA